MYSYSTFVKHREFFLLNDLVIQQASIPVNEDVDSTKHNFSIKDGVHWEYFPGNFKLRDDHVTPSLHRRITEMVIGFVRSLAAIVYHLYLIIIKLNDSFSWKDIGKQFGFCLGRDALEILSHLLLPFHHQYAKLFINHHRLQRFCLINFPHEYERSHLYAAFLEELIKKNEIVAKAYLDKTSYEVFSLIVRHLYEVKKSKLIQDKFEAWSKDNKWIVTDFSQQILESKLFSIMRCSELSKYGREDVIVNDTIHDTIIEKALNYLSDTVIVCWESKNLTTFTDTKSFGIYHVSKLTFLLRDANKKLNWCSKILKLEMKTCRIIEEKKKKAEDFIKLHATYISPLLEKENNPQVCEELFDKKITRRDPGLIKFAKYLFLKNRKEENLLYFKIATKIYIMFGVLSRHFYHFEIEKRLIELLTNKKNNFDSLFKLNHDLNPIKIISYKSFRNHVTFKFLSVVLKQWQAVDLEEGDSLNKFLALDESYIDSQKPSKAYPPERGIKLLARCFELLEFIKMNNNNFRTIINSSLLLKYGLPKDMETVEKILKINPKFLRYCHEDVFNDKELLLKISLLDITAIYFANISLRSIEALKIESLKCLLLINMCNLIEVRKYPKLPKNLLINIFAFSIANTNQEAHCLSEKIRLLPTQ